MYAISPWEACRGPAPVIDADTVFELHLVLEDMRSRAVLRSATCKIVRSGGREHIVEEKRQKESQMEGLNERRR